MWRFICQHQSIYNLDTRVLPPSSCQSVEAVPEEKYGLSKQNNLFLPQIPFLRLDVKLHHPILPSFASSDDHFLATTTFGFDIIVWRIIVSIMLTGWLVLEMQNQPVELATTFESDGAMLRNRSRHLQLSFFQPACHMFFISTCHTILMTMHHAILMSICHTKCVKQQQIGHDHCHAYMPLQVSQDNLPLVFSDRRPQPC